MPFHLGLGFIDVVTVAEKSDLFMKQSRPMSLVEAIANVLVGYGLAVVTQILVFPLFGLRTTLSENLAMGLVFTIVSLARSYALRRTFEAIRTGWRRSSQPAP